MAQNQTIEAVAGKPNLTREYAKSFIKQVKREFGDNVGKYAKFRQVILDFKNGRIDVHSMLLVAKELLEGHNKLIIGFNAFLPEKYKVKVDLSSGNNVSACYEDKVKETTRQIRRMNLEDGTINT